MANFVNNLQNGIPILPYQGETSQSNKLGYRSSNQQSNQLKAKDVELVKLSKYLQLLALNEDYQRKRYTDGDLMNVKGKIPHFLTQKNGVHFGFERVKNAKNIHQAYQLCISG